MQSDIICLTCIFCFLISKIGLFFYLYLSLCTGPLPFLSHRQIRDFPLKNALTHNLTLYIHIKVLQRASGDHPWGTQVLQFLVDISKNLPGHL
jgi:hypothetical protein